MSPVKRDLVILACAVSAGVHGALVPEHFAEGAGPGVGFVIAAAVLAGLYPAWRAMRMSPALAMREE